jgi:hypothetical protein
MTHNRLEVMDNIAAGFGPDDETAPIVDQSERYADDDYAPDVDDWYDDEDDDIDAECPHGQPSAVDNGASALCTSCAVEGDAADDPHEPAHAPGSCDVCDDDAADADAMAPWPTDEPRTVTLTAEQADTAHALARIELQAATREREAIDAESCDHAADHCDRCARAFIARQRVQDARSLVDTLENGAR